MFIKPHHAEPIENQSKKVKVAVSDLWQVSSLKRKWQLEERRIRCYYKKVTAELEFTILKTNSQESNQNEQLIQVYKTSKH